MTSTTSVSISKSLAKASACERYLALTYFSGLPRTESRFSEIGTDFHRYRAEYVTHLIQERLPCDLEWVVWWIESSGVTDETADLVRRDSDTFSINPENVFGTEVYLSVDENFRPLAREIGTAPRLESDPSFAHGTLDLLEIVDDRARIIDAKTGWKSRGDAYEAVHYSALVFCHFDYVNTVTFAWDAIRAKSVLPVMFTRDDLPLLLDRIRLERARAQEILEKHLRKEELSINPGGGVCGFCDLVCPLRQAVTQKLVDLGPVQTPEDAASLALKVYIAGMYYSRGRKLLAPYLEKNGPLEVCEGIIAEMKPSESTEYPLRASLAAVGIEVPQNSPVFDVPIENLTVGAAKLRSYAKAKKRAGLAERLNRIAVVTRGFDLKVHLAGDQE